MTDQKLNLYINLGETRYLEVPDIINYKLVHDSETTDRIDWIKFTSTQRLPQSLMVKLSKNTVIFWSGKITVCLR